MTTQNEDIEFPGGLDWTRPGVVRDVVLLHQKLHDEGMQKGLQAGLRAGLQEGRREGADLGRREALLDVAAAIASGEQLAELRAIDDVRDLAYAVKAMLAR